MISLSVPNHSSKKLLRKTKKLGYSEMRSSIKKSYAGNTTAVSREKPKREMIKIRNVWKIWMLKWSSCKKCILLQ